MTSNSTLLILLVALIATTARGFVARQSAAAVSSTTSSTRSISSPQSQTSCPSTSTTQLALSDKPEIEVISNPDQDFLEKKGVLGWGTWGCPVSKFPWSYGDNESCYLLAGKVTVTPDDGRKAATFEKGDFATFPAGMSCTWDVTEAVEKHYMFF